MKLSISIPKCLFLLNVFFSLNNAYSQVGIGTTVPNSDAALEVYSVNQGLLLPRVSLSSTNVATPLSTHVQGMTVYNTATAGTGTTGVTPGYYVNDGTKWIRIMGASASGDLTDDAWINNIANSRIELGTLSDGTTARPNGSQLVFTDSGFLGIGTNTPTEAIEIKGKDADIDTYTFDVNDLTIFHIHGAGGSLAAPLSFSTRASNNIFGIEAKAYDGSSYKTAGSMYITTDLLLKDLGATSMPGKIVFKTTPSGSTTALERLTIRHDGKVGIGIITPATTLDVNGLFKTKGYTVATLPTAPEAVKGAMAYVTDATAPSYLAALTGGGTVACPVFYNGSNWVSH